MAVGVAVGVLVAVGVTPVVPVGVGVTVGVAVGAPVGVGVALRVAVGVAVGVLVGGLGGVRPVDGAVGVGVAVVGHRMSSRPCRATTGMASPAVETKFSTCTVSGVSAMQTGPAAGAKMISRKGPAPL